MLVITALSVMYYALCHYEHYSVVWIPFWKLFTPPQHLISGCSAVESTTELKQIPPLFELSKFNASLRRDTNLRQIVVSYSLYCNAICSGFVEDKAVLCWESRRLDASELMMMYTGSREILACDVAACKAVSVAQWPLVLCASWVFCYTSSYHRGRPFTVKSLLFSLLLYHCTVYIYIQYVQYRREGVNVSWI